MKLTTGILAAVMMTGGAWAQNPNIVNNVQNKMTAVEQQQSADSNAALGLQETPANTQSSKPSAGAPASGVKPANAAAVKPMKAAVPPKPTTASASNSNKLEKVDVTHRGDEIQIEIGTQDAVTPNVDKLTSPDRLVVELPATAMATEHSKIPVGSAGVKGVRIGMNGKTPPTTSVVVDLEHALKYEISPGPANKFVLTLHSQGSTEVAAKTSPAPAPAKAPQKQTLAAKAVVPVPTAAPKTTAAVRTATAKSEVVAKAPVAIQTSKPATTVAAPKVAAAVKPAAPKAAPEKIVAKAEPKPASAATADKAADDKLAPIGKTAEASKEPKPEDKKWAMTGSRDPFFSPVRQEPSGSGCSTGKKCLEIGQINVRGIVKSEAGFIAVVTNSMNKAYFLHENDPVFNGYVMRITEDSVVFQETYQDKLGKPVTREVTKRVVAPAV
jgi:Tfp pilus assembly protein PilP